MNKTVKEIINFLMCLNIHFIIVGSIYVLLYLIQSWEYNGLFLHALIWVLIFIPYHRYVSKLINYLKY